VVKDNSPLQKTRIIKKLPHIFGRHRTVPRNLIGATIVQIGTFSDSSLAEGGGLVIDYSANGEPGQTRRAILAFDGTEMWVASDGPVET
jgi:hypothetical protein